MVLQVHVWTADLRRYDQNHGVDRHNRDYNSVILEKAVATVDLHGRACDFAVKTKYVFAHGVLELSYDTFFVTRLAHTNRMMWSLCKALLTTERHGTKIWVSVPQRYRQIGRPIERDDDRTPPDVNACLFNKRVHEWRHHHLPLQQFSRLQVHHVLQG